LIKDLSSLSGEKEKLRTQVCIIGAGVAGIFLANKLSENGIQVTILESGGKSARGPEIEDHFCEQLGNKYHGAINGRSFGLGGTSALWGGQMLPLSESDISARPSVGIDCWPIEYREIEPYFSSVRKELGLDGYSIQTLRNNFSNLKNLSKNFILRLSVWIPFKKRNFSKAYSKILSGNSSVTVWLNAPVVKLERAEVMGQTKISKVFSQSLSGKSLEVESEIVVICAGALESTRLLLAYDEEYNRSITSKGAPLGRFFSDHLSVTCGQFRCINKRRFNFAVAPIFYKNLMHTPRLELTLKTQNELKLTSAFAHFTFITKGNTGIDFVRSLLRSRQGEKNIELKLSIKMIWIFFRDIFMLGFWRFVYHRLWFPSDSELLLQIDIEQAPNSESRLLLSTERDKLGRKRLIIDWKISTHDLNTIKKVAQLTELSWKNSVLSEFAKLEINLPDNFYSFKSLYDVYHPTGSIRMGHSDSNSVINKNLRLWDANNCYVTSTAIFPSAGSANPGLTHLALTARLSDHIIDRIRRDSNKS
jgi:UDP-galactopyranose mutase